MIGRLRGTLVQKQPPYLMLDVNGVGYDLEASLTTFQSLPEIGAEVVLHTHLAVREDTHNLYGFATLRERTLFRDLIKVSGIGAKLALLILSGMDADAFARSIRAGDTAALVRLPGIGKKTAERLVVEMRDRIGEAALKTIAVGSMDATAVTATSPADAMEDAISALVNLGYKLPEASRMVRKLDTEGLSSEEIIRQALQATVR